MSDPVAAPDTTPTQHDPEYCGLALSLAEQYAGRRWVALLEAERQKAGTIPCQTMRLEAERAADEVLKRRAELAKSLQP